MKGRFVIMGSGGSMGVPVIGCSCHTCSSADPRNKRRRAAALVLLGDKRLVIDAGPDLREQLLQWQVDRLDGLLLTHAHHDHIAGLDDLRPLVFKRRCPLPLLLSQHTLSAVESCFYYLFGGANLFEVRPLPGPRGCLPFEGVPLRFTTYHQGAVAVTGFRFGDLAYISDIKDYPDTIFADLAGVQTLILSALRYTASPVHLSVDEAIAFARKVGARQSFLTHIAHELEHRQAEDYLPPNMHMAYDGLSLDFTVATEG